MRHTHMRLYARENVMHELHVAFLHYYQDQLQSDTFKFEYDCYTLHLNVSRSTTDITPNEPQAIQICECVLEKHIHVSNEREWRKKSERRIKKIGVMHS